MEARDHDAVAARAEAEIEAVLRPAAHAPLDWRREEIDGRPVVRVKVGALSALLTHMLSPFNDDPDFVPTMAVCGHLFTSEGQIIAHLFQCHARIVSSPDAASASARMRHLIRVLTTCLPSFWHAFDDAAVAKLYDVMATGVGMGHCASVYQLRARLLQCRTGPVQKPIPSGLHVSTRRTLMDFTVHELAQQMTLLQHRALCDVRIPEMLAWRAKQDKVASASVVAMCDLSNRMTLWTASQIIQPQNAADRAKVFTRIVEIADQLRKQNDFASLFALCAGASLSCVTRLAATMAQVRVGVQELFTRICTISKVDKSYKNYRELLGQTRPPVVPYLGIHLTDLTFTEGFNKNMAPCPDGCGASVINFRKYLILFSICAPIIRAQEVSYDITPNTDILALFQNFSHLTEDTLHELSLYAEPRLPTNASSEA